jgi:hypothetical protein
MINLPRPQQLRYLMALAESRHFGGAALACAVTQSTLSAGILALERQLDAAIVAAPPCRCGRRDGGNRRRAPSTPGALWAPPGVRMRRALQSI